MSKHQNWKTDLKFNKIARPHYKQPNINPTSNANTYIGEK